MIGNSNMKKIRTAIIGLGNIAHGYDDIASVKKRLTYPTHVSVLKQDKRFVLVAASDASARQRDIFKKKVSKEVVLYADYRAMLNKEKIDLMVVAVPTDLHLKVCSVALAAGIKYILCEKPMVSTVAEAKKLLALVKRYAGHIMVNYQRSYSADTQKFMSVVEKKKRGRLVFATVQYSGGIFNTATHMIHLVEKMFGPIQKICSIAASVCEQRDPNISFTAFGRGFEIVFKGINNSVGQIFEIDMQFTKKNITLHGDFFAQTSMRDVYESAYQFITRRKKPVADMFSSVHALAVAEKALASAKNGKTIII
ncbi:hypothetical protein BK004_01355 [bacterium CG10_46_32]|nr:MAG: hypothetical protein BK004_01355 [bacterium CG10_46_32]